jgi:cell wall-associated NlpC family hydrolase
MFFHTQNGWRAIAQPRKLLMALVVITFVLSSGSPALAWDRPNPADNFGQAKESLVPEPAPSYGSLIANTALGYVGYPYVYAGAGPYGFDCSGFTQYIVGITTGIWISHAVEAQPYSAGTWVNYGEWQPGDLIFFQNTYRAGISHVGIYIGDGQIVHAENESTGVTIDSIYSSYYGPRYWGAVRIA